MSLQQVLSEGGYEPQIESVSQRDAFTQALESGDWDIVITDHNIPGLSSTDTLSLVQGTGRDIPVIIISGSTGEEIAVSSMKAGAHDYIMKKDLGRLVPAIERELHEAKERRARKKVEDTLWHLAYHDALTGLINRHEFETRLMNALQTAREGNQSHALLYLDLDKFKIINDTCGHIAGDELLRQLAIVMRSHVRDSDTLARLGGDEFGVLLTGCGLDDAVKIAGNLLKLIVDFRFVWRTKAFNLGVSIGLVVLDTQSGALAEVLGMADLACYAAKDLGRNRIQVYRKGEMESERRRGEVQWVARLNQALDEDRLALYAQRIVPLNGTNPGHENREIFVRLVEANGDLIQPGAFIPAAERHNITTALDSWVVDAAFKHLAQLQSGEDESGNATFFINLSCASLSDTAFSEFIREKLRAYALRPGSVCFEITETAAITNMSATVEFMKKMRREGCKFALDDFGSGLSSFCYLRTLSVDYLKIDGGFIQGLSGDPMNRAIVEAISQIGHVAGLQTIAEYVEDANTKAQLATLGVDFAQGYGIEPPLPLTLALD